MNFEIVRQTASEDFNKARNKALLNEIQNFMNPDKRRLISFNDLKKILKPKNEVYVGMKTVPIKKIVGSEGRYHDFDNHFLPRSNMLRRRWERADQAHLSDIILPPIQLYELAGLYFVRDGNHRVSVAKAQGIEFIDAEIISLQSEIVLPTDVRPDTLVPVVIHYEKRIFYAQTNFGDITDYWDLNFTETGRYDVIYNHILVHKYFLNEQRNKQNQSEELPFNDVILSWFQTVYTPTVEVIRKYGILSEFKRRTESDIYVWLVKHWDELKQKYGANFSLDDAGKDFVQAVKKQQEGFFKRLKNFAANRFLFRKNN
ncbi:transcriptional regulator [Treponema phagedenis]|uniref:transcriptional regulator n=1 Tax=Treponema phagedenis TaxID=162 RepID=UPI0011E7DB20|nr:transcriptional regulator [Treponema phagedenis]QEK03411.1 transcriptional regulator [Treponema phagedenis]QEK09038.1 transcriptional regulator [Treponema phagedenis]